MVSKLYLFHNLEDDWKFFIPTKNVFQRIYFWRWIDAQLQFYFLHTRWMKHIHLFYLVKRELEGCNQKRIPHKYTGYYRNIPVNDLVITRSRLKWIKGVYISINYAIKYYSSFHVLDMDSMCSNNVVQSCFYTFAFILGQIQLIFEYRESTSSLGLLWKKLNDFSP